MPGSIKKERIVVCWSGGKDSTMMLHEMTQSGIYEFAVLLTTVTDAYDRISMHGVRRSLLEEQARSLNIPLHMLFITKGASNLEYEEKMKKALLNYYKEGIRKVAFGDIFLEDLKKYRDAFLAKLDMTGLYPIWKRDTSELVRTFMGLGYKAHVTCVDTKVLDGAYSGRLIDASFVNDLPSAVDPCGERGEFHSFVFDGPLFKNEVQLAVGKKVQRDQFCFTDLVHKKGVLK